jgi:hypothetical protein
VVLISFFACSDILETNSNRLLNTDDNQLNSANDSLYSVVGILNQLQKLGDRYVILGELRGELMDITENSHKDLQDIHNFTATAANPYFDDRAYYEIINNCNYFIRHVDTTVLSGGIKVMLKEYAVVKAIRAWTYMQMALNYGKVTYFEEPILSISDMNKDYPEYDFNRLADLLIADLQAFEETEYPGYGNIGVYNSHYYFIPIPVLLGDLYLWKGQYEEAAQIYYRLIYRESKNFIRRSYYSVWNTSLFVPEDRIDNWIYLFDNFEYEVMTVIPFSSEYGNNSKVFNMTMPVEMAAAGSDLFSYELVPSQVAKEMWKNEVYTYYNENPSAPVVAYNYGDLRGENGSYRNYVIAGDTVPAIDKYYSSEQGNNGIIYTSVFLYRTATLYLHLAEAMNQLGKPSLAFAVLKYGLSNETLNNPDRVSFDEITPLPNYCNFTDSRFDGNIAIRGRTLGYPERDSVYYVWDKDLANKADSIRFVDDLICRELALETAFEGNRFHDLMRFALRRNDPAFLADKVGQKHKNPAIREKLMNTNNWYLPAK